MRVFALVGSSGTGKSHRSMWVAKKYNVDCMIDDGLLISQNKIIAGKSAKKEPTKIASVRRAIFTAPLHAEQVKQAILKNNFQSVLIIGTSEKMVTQIAVILELPPIEKIINIEDVSSAEDINIAKKIRTIEGKHVIPVPTFEVKKHFSGYLLHPLELLHKISQNIVTEEKTIMRPTYSYLGHFEISDAAISDICTHEALKNPNIIRVFRVKTNMGADKSIVIEIDISLKYPNKLHNIAKDASKKIIASVEEYTALNVKRLITNVKSISIS